MVLFDPVIGILHNFKSQTWHPVLFTMHPFPGDYHDQTTVERYRSIGHHTTGFSSRDAALADVKESAEKLKDQYIGKLHFALSKDFSWDGEDLPTMTVIFDLQDDNAIPLFN